MPESVLKAKKNVCEELGTLAMEADKRRYLAELFGDSKEADVAKEEFLMYESMNRLIAPAEYCFNGFKAVEDFGYKYQKKIVLDEMKEVDRNTWNYDLLKERLEWCNGMLQKEAVRCR